MGGCFYSNCLFWAYWQKLTKGGRVKTRPSQYTRCWHWMWSPDGKTFKSFVPVNPKIRLIPPPIFWGEVRDE